MMVASTAVEENVAPLLANGTLSLFDIKSCGRDDVMLLSEIISWGRNDVMMVASTDEVRNGSLATSLMQPKPLSSLATLLMQLKPLSYDDKHKIIKDVIENLTDEECKAIQTIVIMAIPNVLKIILSHLEPEQMVGLLHSDMKEDLFMALKEDVTVIESVSDRLKGDHKFMLEAVKINGFALEYASDELRGDHEIVVEAVRKNGFALEYASDELRGDPKIVMEAVLRDGCALEYASEELRDNREIAMEAIDEHRYALQFASRDYVLEAVKKNGKDLKYASEELKGDHEIVMEAIKENRYALRFASSHYVSEAVKKNVGAGDELKLMLGAVSVLCVGAIIVMGVAGRWAERGGRGDRGHYEAGTAMALLGSVLGCIIFFRNIERRQRTALGGVETWWLRNGGRPSRDINYDHSAAGNPSALPAVPGSALN